MEIDFIKGLFSNFKNVIVDLAESVVLNIYRSHEKVVLTICVLVSVGMQQNYQISSETQTLE